jgi:hypothetical protein
MRIRGISGNRERLLLKHDQIQFLILQHNESNISKMWETNEPCGLAA